MRSVRLPSETGEKAEGEGPDASGVEHQNEIAESVGKAGREKRAQRLLEHRLEADSQRQPEHELEDLADLIAADIAAEE